MPKKSNAEKQKDYRNRKKIGFQKQRVSQKPTNEALIAIVQAKYDSLLGENEKINKLTMVYGLMIDKRWNRTQSSEAVNMWMISTGNNLENTTKPKSGEYDEFKKILGGPEDPEAINLLMHEPESQKEFLREWYAKNNTPEAFYRRLEVYYFLKGLNEWLRAKNLEFQPEYLVSEFEIWTRSHPERIKGLNQEIIALNKIPHDPKNRIVTNNTEREALHSEFWKIWKDDHPNSLLWS